MHCPQHGLATTFAFDSNYGVSGEWWVLIVDGEVMIGECSCFPGRRGSGGGGTSCDVGICDHSTSTHSLVSHHADYICCIGNAYPRSRKFTSLSPPPPPSFSSTTPPSTTRFFSSPLLELCIRSSSVDYDVTVSRFKYGG